VPVREPAEQVVKNIRRATRRHFSAEDKIHMVLEGLRGEDSIAELCRREGIVQNLYYRWSKEFLEAGKKRLAGDTARAATSDEVKDYSAVSARTIQFEVGGVSRCLSARSNWCASMTFAEAGRTTRAAFARRSAAIARTRHPQFAQDKRRSVMIRRLGPQSGQNALCVAAIRSSHL
jgi:transposase-like protein